jgi:alpha-tubulin suppressor-like RCC1 family protein
MFGSRNFLFAKSGVSYIPPSPGQLWAWGRGRNGQLGLNDVENRSSPVQVGTSTNWLKLSGGYENTFAITDTGQLWAWGVQGLAGAAYFGGALGVGDFLNRSSPTQVGTMTNWATVAGGGFTNTQSTGAIKTDGTLWVWGRNGYGSLAGNATNGSPVQVGALTNWEKIAGGGYFFAAIKTDKTLWVWGRNNGGQLGLGDTDNRSSPTIVGSGTDWYEVTCAQQTGTANLVMQAVKTDGTLWGWGKQGSGVLGLGNSTYRSSPVQVGALTNWDNVWQGCGDNATPNIAFATKKDGTAWVWGSGNFGGLGLGNTNSYNSPVQLGALTNWLNAKVSISTQRCAVVKSDNTLWTWGNGTYGRQGLGNTNNNSSPVQVGSLTTWQSVKDCPSDSSVAAIKIP